MLKKLLLCSFLCMTSISYAGEQAALPKDKWPVNLLNHNIGLIPIKEFKVSPDFIGYVVYDQRGKTETIIYSSKDRKYLFAGMLMDESGVNLTSKYAETYLKKLPPKP